MACAEEPDTAGPFHSKVVGTSESRPAVTCVAVVDVVLPPPHVRPPVGKVWHPAALAEIVHVLHEQAMAVCVSVAPVATGIQHSPVVASVRALITQQDASMATMFEELHPEQAPSCMNVPRGFAIPPAVAPIIVDGVPVVDPQLGTVIGNEREPVTASAVEPDTAGPAHSKVVGTRESRPPATCVAVVDVVPPPRHVRPPVGKMWHTAALTEIEGILPEQAMAVYDSVADAPVATGIQHSPAVVGVWATITQQDASMATTFEELHPEHAPSCMNVPRGFAIPPAVEPIIVDGVTVVDPQLGTVIGNEREPVMASAVEPDTAGPFHSKVVGTSESRPLAICVAVVDVVLPPPHVRPPVGKVLHPVALM